MNITRLGHDLKSIRHPGDSIGYLRGSSTRPGTLAGWFPTDRTIYKCKSCGLLMCAESYDENATYPLDIETCSDIRFSFGSISEAFFVQWQCEGE